MRQYELWWARMPDPVGRRPVLLLSRTPAYEYLSRGIPVEFALGRREGLRRKSVANLDSVHVIPRARLEARIGTLSPTRTDEVKRALGYALDWLELKRLGNQG
jgi:mRNA interferase MazF